MSKNLVAVYGSLRSDLGNHRIIKNGSKTELLGTFTTEPIYTLYSLGGFPGLKKDGETAVTVEVYEVDNETAYLIDCLEGYHPDKPATFYDKEYIQTPWGNAGIYIYVNDLEGKAPVVESGDWKKYYL